LKYYIFVICSFLLMLLWSESLNAQTAEDLSLKAATEEQQAEAADESKEEMERQRARYNLQIDSLTRKKLEALKRVEENIDKFTQQRFKIKSYKKEELVANLVYKLAYYYHSLEDESHGDVSELIENLFSTYQEKMELQGGDAAKQAYLDQLMKIAPSLFDEYDESFLVTDDPSDVYRGDYKKSLEYYQKIIDEYPTSKLAPYSYYNIAFILYDLGRKDEAVDIYQKIIKSYPNSEFYNDANFALGEYFFDPELNPDDDSNLRVELVSRAIGYYGAILDAPNNEDYYFKALYRLGFCYYRIYDYMRAADYLTDTIEKMYERYGLEEQPDDMRTLSIEYLAFCFKDNQWDREIAEDELDVSTIIELKNHIENRKKENYSALYLYGSKILGELGEAYAKGEEFDLAIAAYDSLLAMYPLIKEAPRFEEKIIEAYASKQYDNEDDRLEALYRERNELYERYNVTSAWSEGNSSERDSLQTDQLIASNLYQNIRYSLDVAQKENDNIYFENTISHVDQYLTDLPVDSNTYRLKWYKARFLEHKLNRFLEAFDMYVMISKDSLTQAYYDKESNSMFTDTLAALSAINAAQKFKKQEESLIDTTLAVADTALISPGNRKHINAFKNYADLFPGHEAAPKYLFDAAILLHNKKAFEENEQHLNDIISRYPNDPVAYKSFKMLYDEYNQTDAFAKAEEVSKKMESLQNLTEAQIKDISQRKFFSMYKLAKAEQQSAETTETTRIDSSGQVIADESLKYQQLKKSAGNFIRTARENPAYKDAGQAVWEASLLYAQAKEWDSVFVAYNYLIDDFKGYKNKDSLDLSAVSLYKLGDLVADTIFTKYASSYEGPLLKDLKQNSKQAAGYFEAFYKAYPVFQVGEEDLAKSAVANAAYFYKQAEEWESTLRMNRVYIDKYSEGESVEAGVARLVDMAKTYMKLGEEKKAFAIYGELGGKYPDAPFAVEGYYERANYYLTRGNRAQAKQDFEACYQASKRLQNKGKKDFGAFFASEALFTLTEWDRIDYEKVDFSSGSKQEIETRQTRKRQEFVRLGKKYQEVITYGKKEYGPASIMQARISENYADAVFKQKRFPQAVKIDELAIEEGIGKEAVLGYEKSIELYTSSIKSMDIFTKSWDTILSRNISQLDSVLKKDSTNIHLINRRRSFKNDSTVAVTNKLKDQAKHSVLRMQYTLANVFKNLAESYVNMTPEDIELSGEDLGFYEEVFTVWIDTQAAPRVVDIIKAHQKTLLLAKDFGIREDEWVLKSRDEIARSANIIIDAYTRLANRLINLYKKSDEYILKLNRKKLKRDNDYFVVAPTIALDGERGDQFAVHEKMASVIEYLGTALEKSVENYDNNFIAAKENLDKKGFDQLKSEYLNNIIQYTGNLERLVDFCMIRQRNLQETLSANEDLRELYDDNSEFLEAYKDQSTDIRDKMNDLYVKAFEKIQEYSIKNEYTNTIFYQVVSRMPSDYYEEFGLGVTKNSVVTDFSWKALPVEQQGWYRSDFDAKDWVEPDSVVYSERIEGDSLYTSLQAQPIWTHYDPIFEKLQIKQPEEVEEEEVEDEEEIAEDEESKRMFFFRKDFELDKIPVTADMYLTVDNMFGFLVNEETQFNMLMGDDAETYEDLEAEFDEPYTKWNKARRWDISSALINGKNSIVIYAFDSDSVNNGVTGVVNIETLDRKISEEYTFVLKSEQDGEMDDQEERERKRLIRIFRKNSLN